MQAAQLLLQKWAQIYQGCAQLSKGLKQQRDRAVLRSCSDRLGKCEHSRCRARQSASNKSKPWSSSVPAVDSTCLLGAAVYRSSPFSVHLVSVLPGLAWRYPRLSG